MMKNDVYIRSYSTGRYLMPLGGWSAVRTSAREFLSLSAARDWCVEGRLINVEIVVVRDELLCMRVPVQE